MSKFITIEPNRGLTPNKQGKVVDKPCPNGLFNCHNRGCYFRHAEKGDTPASSIKPTDAPTNSVKFAVFADEFVPKLPECGSIVLEFKQAPPAPPKVEDFSKYMPSDDEVDATTEDVSCDIQAVRVDMDALNAKIDMFIEPMDRQVGNITRKTSEQAQKIALLESTVRNQEGKIDLLERMLMSMDKALASLREELYASQQAK